MAFDMESCLQFFWKSESDSFYKYLLQFSQKRTKQILAIAWYENGERFFREELETLDGIFMSGFKLRKDKDRNLILDSRDDCIEALQSFIQILCSTNDGRILAKPEAGPKAAKKILAFILRNIFMANFNELSLSLIIQSSGKVKMKELNKFIHSEIMDSRNSRLSELDDQGFG